MDWVEALSCFEEIDVHPNDCWHEWWDDGIESPQNLLQRCNEIYQVLRLMRDETAIVVLPPRLLRHLVLEHEFDDEENHADEIDGLPIHPAVTSLETIFGSVLTPEERYTSSEAKRQRIADLIHELRTHHEIPRTGVLCVDFDFSKNLTHCIQDVHLMLDTNLLSKEEKKKQQSLHRAYVEKARSMEKSGPLPRARFQDPSVENTENEHKYHENEHPGNMTMIELHQLMMDEPELTIEMVKVFEKELRNNQTNTEKNMPHNHRVSSPQKSNLSPLHRTLAELDVHIDDAHLEEIKDSFAKVVGKSPLNVVGQYHHAVDPHLVLMDAINDIRKKEMELLGLLNPEEGASDTTYQGPNMTINRTPSQLKIEKHNEAKQKRRRSSFAKNARGE